MSKPSLLFISPTPPAMSGNGLSMRAGALLAGLSEWAEVHLLVLPLGNHDCRQLQGAVIEQCRQVRLVGITPLMRRWWRLHSLAASVPLLGKRLPPLEFSLNRQLVPKALDVYARRPFDRLFVFRTYMIPFAQAWFRGSPEARRHLDIDDIESVTRRRLGELHARNGRRAEAARLLRESAFYSAYEKSRFPLFHSLSVCSVQDREAVRALAPQAGIEILPNTLPELPAAGARRATTIPNETFNFLFVGTLGYYPNEDAVRFSIADILPRIRARSRRAVRFTVVGSGSAAWTQQVSPTDCRFILGAEDLAEHYRSADAVVVPLRAGGGTRIKVLEAFVHGCPLVATHLAVEGLDLEHGRQALLAEDAWAFAGHCLALMQDDSLSASLIEAGQRLWRQRFHPDALKPIFKRLLAA